MNRRVLHLATAFLSWLLCTQCQIGVADNTWVYAVQITATIAENPPSIRLDWRPDPYGAFDYVVSRKTDAGTSWGTPVATLSGDATSYTDTSVEIGRAYEYQVVKRGKLGYKGYGYIYSGIRIAAEEDRGTLLLVVESNATAGLGAEIARLRSDLTGDGYVVKQLNVSSNDTPEAVKSAIYQRWLLEPERLKNLFLLGHVPVMHSGKLDWDTHGPRPMPSDAYYADISNHWPTSTNDSPSYLPSDTELMTGRVDFFAMPGLRSKQRWPSEPELLKRYLDKDHKWRHAQMPVPRRALMGNARGDEYGGAAAATAYRFFDAFVGRDNIVEADVSYSPPLSERWISKLADEPYLWAYGCGGGQADGCGGLGTNVVGGVPGYLYSSDVLAVDAKAVFVMMFGSWFGQWDLPDDLLRTFLATPSYGLAAAMAGRPHWFMHHMGLGKPIGYSTRLSMNNFDTYRTQSNGFPRAVYTALLGDPSLRMEPLRGPSWISATRAGAGVSLQWESISFDAAPAQYHLYRSATVEGPFTRITEFPVGENSFVHTAAGSAPAVYMVRAVHLQKNNSGSYYNLSQGAFAAAQAGQGTPLSQPRLQAALASGGRVRIQWTTQVGQTYKVQTSSSISGGWKDASGAVQVSGGIATWQSTALDDGGAVLFRVSSSGQP